ncbi:hypothetical protein PU629_13380 [Pullulanibacillus sp. KACC 23026]|uniref:hypothetical protein n=1 Tax=Pullulanibacillus sp. KACC 23026 TaxID=3028315 RepID=UPI0023AF1855|nr:hypothetical protein [Pullulanibacillus sp. KACC 23026]WEG11160.1 hypothetical protein PU629_13380 [Pullulanibacillus sp. KACC 23026]
MTNGQEKKEQKKLKKTAEEKEDFDTCSFYCKTCDHKFELEWEIIFEIQECTHGYVGYHLNDVFINCPKCDRIVTEEPDEEDDFLLNV